MDTESSVGSRTLQAVVAVVLLVLTGLGIVYVANRPTGDQTLVVGDSVTFLSVNPIDSELGSSKLQIIARPGYRSIDLLPILRKAMAGHGTPAAARDRAVFLVGYNDVARRTVDTSDLGSMLRDSDEFRCAVWFTVPARPGGAPSTNPHFNDHAVDLWNARIRKEAERYPHVHVARDWQNAVETSKPGELIQPDGLHPNQAGRRHLAAAMKAALDRVC